MNKALLISIQPQHAVNILNGKKTLELRTWIPKDYKGWVYVYITKGKRLSVVHDDENGKTYYYLNSNWGRELNENIPFRFWFDDYDTLEYIHKWNGSEYIGDNQFALLLWYVDSNYLDSLCLDYQDVLDYGFREKPKPHQKTLYAWHIKKLEIFDTPKELSHFYKYDKKWSKHYKTWQSTKCHDELNKFRLKKAPQRSVWIYE